jgi:hypothetical protein
MTPPDYIAALNQYLIDKFIPYLASRDPEVIQSLKISHCHLEWQAKEAVVEFQLQHLFNALWLSATNDGVALPIHSDWSTDFEAFARQLAQPSFLAQLEQAGAKLKLIHPNPSKAKAQYQLRVSATA